MKDGGERQPLCHPSRLTGPPGFASLGACSCRFPPPSPSACPVEAWNDGLKSLKNTLQFLQHHHSISTSQQTILSHVIATPATHRHTKQRTTEHKNHTTTTNHNVLPHTTTPHHTPATTTTSHLELLFQGVLGSSDVILLPLQPLPVTLLLSPLLRQLAHFTVKSIVCVGWWSFGWCGV